MHVCVLYLVVRPDVEDAHVLLDRLPLTQRRGNWAAGLTDQEGLKMTPIS